MSARFTAEEFDYLAVTSDADMRRALKQAAATERELAQAQETLRRIEKTCAPMKHGLTIAEGNSFWSAEAVEGFKSVVRRLVKGREG